MFRAAVCIDPAIDPKSLNYMFESTSNEIMLKYEKPYKIDNLDGFRLKFSSDKPSSK